MPKEVFENSVGRFQIDPVEHAVVEAGWGESLVHDNDNSEAYEELYRRLGSPTTSKFVETHISPR